MSPAQSPLFSVPKPLDSACYDNSVYSKILNQEFDAVHNNTIIFISFPFSVRPMKIRFASTAFDVNGAFSTLRARLTQNWLLDLSPYV
jgi:hypothetical protein